MLNVFCNLLDPRQGILRRKECHSLRMTLFGTRLLTSTTPVLLDEPDPRKVNETPPTSTKVLSGPCCGIDIFQERPDLEGYSGDVEMDIA